MYRSPVCYLLLALLTKIGAQAPSLRWQLDREQILLLPNGNHVAGLLEFYLPPAVLANPDTAGFARAESVQLSLFGESYKWQRWLWQGSDITHPSRPGEPLLYLPLSLLHTVEAHKYAVLVAERNGIHLSTYDFSRKEGAMSFPVEIGGMPFLPRRTLDREPASEWGAPERSRGFAAGSAEAYAAIPWLEDPTKGFLFADAFYARRFFNTLAQAENAGEATLLSVLQPGWNPGDKLQFASAYRFRGNFAAESFVPEKETLSSAQLSAIAQYSFQGDKAAGAFAAGYSYRELNSHSGFAQRPLIEGLLMPPQLFPERTHTLLLDGTGSLFFPCAQWLCVYGVNSRFELESRQTLPAQNFLVETLYGVPVFATIYDGSARELNGLLRWQPFARAYYRTARAELSLSANGHIDWGFTDAGTKVGFVHPAAKLAAKSYLGSTRFFAAAAVLHDTLGFSLQEISFLNRDALSGNRFNFSDSNGNGIPEMAELGSFSRTGGRYHSLARTTEAPQKEELNLDFGYDFANWQIRLNLNGRIYRKLLEVRYAEGTAPQFTPSPAGGSVVVYDKTLSGNESYELRNAENPAHYAHAELHWLQSRPQSRWLVRGAIGGYYAAGYTPHGLGMFYNDLGAYNESTADPNFRENRFARLAGERGYIAKIVLGYRFGTGISLSNMLRYRDGEPMGGYRLVTGLAQGPILVPFELRGGGHSGIGRHTYSFAWDVRLRWEQATGGTRRWAFVDIYNLLNSRTELAEYPLEGPRFRDPLEQGTARTLRIGLGMEF